MTNLADVTLTGGFALQTMDTWQHFIADKDVSLHNNAIELVFEEVDFDIFLNHIKKFDIAYVHDMIEHGWGQRVNSCYCKRQRCNK